MLASRPAKRASEMTASGLPISGARPNSLPRLFRVGPATFLRIMAVRTRAITPLPPRVGPIINKILWRSVRPEII